MSQPAATAPAEPAAGNGSVGATEPVGRLLRDLRASRSGLANREAVRRLIACGPNELRRRGGR
jgi:Cation transporter/ATPase, N-terminus